MSQPTPRASAAMFIAVAVIAVELFVLPSTASAQQKSAASSPGAKQAYAAAAAFQNEGIFELAVEDWEAFLKRFAGDPLAAEARFNLGACYFKLGKFDRAAHAYAAIAETYPNFDRAETNLLNLGIANYKAAQANGGNKDRFHQAAVAFNRFLTQYPQSKDVALALVLRAEALSAAGKQQAAVASWTELIEQHPDAPQHAETLYTVGMALLQNNQPQQARKMFDRLEREHGEHPLAAVALFELGEHEYHRRKDYVAAARAYSAAKSKTQDRELAEKIDYKLGWTYYQQRDFARAEQVFVAMLQHPASGKLAGDARLMLGECLFKQDRFDAAFAHFRKALDEKLSSSDLAAMALLRSGQCAARLKQWADSLKFLDRLTSEQTESPYQDEAALERAGALKNLGRTDEALQQYQIVAEQSASPLAMQAQFMIGRLQADAGNPREAVRSFYKVIHGYGDAKTPSPHQTWKALAIYEAARCFEALENRDGAKRLYRELIERYPQSEKTPAAKERLAALER